MIEAIIIFVLLVVGSTICALVALEIAPAETPSTGDAKPCKTDILEIENRGAGQR